MCDLVGGLDHFLFSIIYGIILPIGELIFFKMVKTTNQVFHEMGKHGVYFFIAHAA